MNNREFFDCIDELVKDKFRELFIVKVFFRHKNIFDDIAEVTIEKVSPDGINEIVYHTNFLGIGREIEQISLKRYLDNLENFLYKKIERKVECSRGDIFWAENHNARGSEQRGKRPYLIVSNNRNNNHASTVTVLPITTHAKKDLPTHSTIYINDNLCTVLAEQITCIPKTDLIEFIKHLSYEEFEPIEQTMRVQLALNKKEEKQLVQENIQPDKKQNRFKNFFDKIKSLFKRKKEGCCE